MGVLLELRGVVQGVGMRPAVARMGAALGLSGFVRNAGGTLQIYLDNVHSRTEADRFLGEILRGKPPLARIDDQTSNIVPDGSADFPEEHGHGFSIRSSAPSGTFWDVPRDTVPCAQCRSDIENPVSRFFQYAFTSCCDCGPRMSILSSLPFDRANTAMSDFPMCAACRDDYINPENRRFHSQTIACPECGPRVTLVNGEGTTVASDTEAILSAADELKRGGIIGLKGVGGWQILVLAGSDSAVLELRRRKLRHRKPFAVMAEDLSGAETLAELTEAERSALAGQDGPIVLCRRRIGAAISEHVAPGSPLIGVMLPSSPLHALLLAHVGEPVVATSGNLSGEPVQIVDTGHEALGSICDLFLTHNRRIVRRLDDSVVTLMKDHRITFRAARGLAPVVLRAGEDARDSSTVVWHLGHGGHMKNSVALGSSTGIVLGPHVGDLDTAAGRDASRDSASDLSRLFSARPDSIVCDLHPDYGSTMEAQAHGAATAVPVLRLQHHAAHAYAVIAERAVKGPVLAVVWDGTGLGENGVLCGSEFLAFAEDHSLPAHSMASLLPFALAGGEAAVKRGCRVAAALLNATYGAPDSTAHEEERAPVTFMSSEERRIVLSLLSSGGTARSTGMGRLFDGVASILDIAHESDYDGEAAMLLEYAAEKGTCSDPYAVELVHEADKEMLDWRLLIRAMDADVRSGMSACDVALRFHHTLAVWIEHVAAVAGIDNVVLAGGCFQNRLLTGLARQRLLSRGFHVFIPGAVPPGDGGLAVGHAYYGVLMHRAGAVTGGVACV